MALLTSLTTLPTFFITFTIDTNCKEIKMKMKMDEKERTSAIVGVFYRKLKKLMDLIQKEQLFGFYIAHYRTIEFQKRGLPHTHIFLWTDYRSDEKII